MKKQLLDPIGTICKLVAINFTPIYTKISMQNHVLTLHTPNNYQFLVRLYNGDGKENISELYYVIIRIIKWYIQTEKQENIANVVNSDLVVYETPEKTKKIENSYKIIQSEEIKKILKYLCDAFKKLQKTYLYGNVVLAIQFYINIIDDGINGVFNDNRLPEYILSKEEEYQNLINYDKLKNLWELDDLRRITELYDKCFSVCNEATTNEKVKEALIGSYLQSIFAILNITEINFQELVQNSNKG